MLYLESRKNGTRYLVLTSLYVVEFNLLLSHFARLWQPYYCYPTLGTHYRSIAAFQEHGNAKREGDAFKRFFLITLLEKQRLVMTLGGQCWYLTRQGLKYS